jgi:hypothetical protein
VDARRQRVRASAHLCGIDYVEVYPDGVTLCVHFFGKVPGEVGAANVAIEGGVRIRDIAVTGARFHEHDDGDTCLLVTIDKTGDFSPYCVCLIEPVASQSRCSYDPVVAAERKVPHGVDPRYACAPFSFRLDCPSSLDCAPSSCSPAPKPEPPPIDYLARDYDSFRRLILDRLAQTMPQWRERHAPDLGITIAELLAYAADQLSYQLDSVATEAFLRTARRRISVRRHARLVDYWMHEGCNARAWVTLDADEDAPGLALADIKFAAMSVNDARTGGIVGWTDIQESADARVFEPVTLDGTTQIDVVAAHSAIDFYTWNRDDCCLPAGSTQATLRDAPAPASQTPEQQPRSTGGETPWRLHLKPGDFLIFEETRGCATGAIADADPSRRHVVRLNRVTKGVDPLTDVRIWDIEWDRDDALPFDLRVSVMTGPLDLPKCESVLAAVARGNVVLVDHGVTVDESSDAWIVAIDEDADAVVCRCDGGTTERDTAAMRLDITLARAPLTFAEPMANLTSARAFAQRDPRRAHPIVRLDASPSDPLAPQHHHAPGDSPAATPHHRHWENTYAWIATPDLLACGPDDTRVAVEIDDDGVSHLRFGDGCYGRRPEASWQFRARYRVGGGAAGNVGSDSIVWMTFLKPPASGATLRPRNPLPATGGTEPESIDVVKRCAPSNYTRVLARAVAADDYAALAESDDRVQGAFGELAWTGGWYEATVAIDPLTPYPAADVEAAARERLEIARRIGHDLRIVPVRKVPLDITLSICVAPDHLRGDIERAVRQRLSASVAPDGSRGFFHPDNWQFGTDVAASPIVAAVQAIDGVTHVELVRFARLYDTNAMAARTKRANLIPVDADEIAILDGDANLPERGRLTLRIRGGR